MPLIKRYSNRKLYDTEAKKYITLEEIADLIRQGEEIQVVDNVTDEDTTALTLTQIILEQEKKKAGFLPRSILAALIQAGGESLSTIRQKLTSPLDLLHQVDEEIDGRIQVLIERGEMAEEAGKKLRDQLIEHSYLWGGLPWISERDLGLALKKCGILTREEFQQLNEQIDALSTKLDELQPKNEVEK